MMNNNLFDTSHDGQLNLFFGAPNGAVGDTPLLAGFSDTLRQIQAVLTRLADGTIDPDQRNAYEEEYMLLANQMSDLVLDAIRYYDRIPPIFHATEEAAVYQTLLYGGFDTAGPIRAVLTRLADAAIDSSQRTTFIEQYSILANQASDFVLDAIHNRRVDLIFDIPRFTGFSATLGQIQAVLTGLRDDSIDSDQRNIYEEQYMLLANQKSDFVLDAIRSYDRIPLIFDATEESYVYQTLLFGGFDTMWQIRAVLTRLADAAIDPDQRTPFIEQYSLLANQASDFVLDAIHNRRFDLIFDAPEAPPAPIPKTLLGGDGADSLIGDDGDDTLAGGAGDDLLEARGGQNQASGGDGNDTITAWGGDNRFFGDAGDDLLKVIGGAFSLSGGAGADTLSVWEEDWVANDVLNGGDGADSLNAGAGDDTLIGGDGADTMIGGAGDDVILAGGTSLQDILSLFTL